MNNNEPITIEEKKRLVAFLKSGDGKLFVKLLKDMHENHLELAQGMYLRTTNPNEQIAAQVNQAAGIKEVLDFIDAIIREIKELKKENN